MKDRRRQQRRLSWPAVVEIAVHIVPAERPFKWIDRSILVAIKLLKMVLGQLDNIGIRNTSTKMIPARIVALGTFQHAVIHEVGSWLHDDFRPALLMNVHTSGML